MRGQRRRAANQRQERLPERQRERDAREHVGTLRDRRRRRDARRGRKLAGRLAARLYSRVVGSCDPLDRGVVVRHDRALKVERGRELARLRPQIRPGRGEGRGRDPRAACELRRRLLGVRAVGVAVEREDDRGEQGAGEHEDEERSPDHRCPEPAPAEPECAWGMRSSHRLAPQERASIRASALPVPPRSPGGVRVSNRGSSGRRRWTA